MVVKEEINNTYGPHGGLKFTTEPDFITLDKATQTSYEEEADDLTQGKRANSFQAHTFVPSKERYYILQTKTKVVRENASPITPESESGDILLNEKQIKKDADKNLEQHQNISLQPDEKAFNEIAGKADTTATVTGQILLAVASLRDTDKTNIQAATAMLNSILKKERNKLSGKVPEIIDIIYFHLRAIQEPSAREAAIGAVCLLAEKHTEETISSLLRLSLLCDRHISKIWEALGQAKQPVRLQVLAKLLEALKKKPCLKSEHPGSNTNLKDNSSLLPLAATKALCIIFRDKKCKVPMNSFYVSVIIFLVIQLHYLVNFSEIEYGQEDILQNSSYISCAMEALKALVKREKSSQTCFTSLAGSWDLLSSPENYIEGVLLLAKAIVKHHRGLDYAVFTKVIPLLHHGDDQQKLTAMAFFTALLSSESTYKVLQKHYILGLLKNWQNDSNPTYRRLSLHGIGNVAHHLQTKEFTALMQDILPSFYDPDEKVILTAIEVVMKVLSIDKNVATHMKIARELQPLLSDDRSKVCCAANRLFQDLLKNLDTKDKPLMQDQVLAMIVPLLLSLQDQHPEVAKSRRDSLKECRAFLGWTTNDNLDSWNVICKHLVEDHRGTLQNFLYQAQDYSHSARPSTRIAATMFIVWHISRFHLPAPGKQSCAKVRNGPLEASLRLLSIRKRASCPCCSGTKKRTQVLPSSIQMFPLFPTILYLKRISIRIKITV
ncbi:maestro heat-like repeat-containing protein family member 6 isoform X2 [Hemicordylus capensis]|uniref:maestro heat-like repeat-containing protein family member 6 isoform X2 n=1 Tax=Hemicordylus capensis TaxID=884348 RepID=UPI0023036B96|nr:maestro heat-like repeat-containing protein family member 6 isoform X2 [Hemicordylus capensis]